MTPEFTALIIIIGSLALILIGIRIIYGIKGLERRGISVDGSVISLESSPLDDSNAIFPKVTFRTKDNVLVTKTSRLSSIPGFYKVGQKIEVVYNPNDPESFIIKDNKTFVAPLFMIIIGIILLVYIFISSKT